MTGFTAPEYGLPSNDPDVEPAPAAAGQQQQSGSGLRQQLEAALAEKKAMGEKLAALEAKDRAAGLAAGLKAAGLGESAAKFYPKDADTGEAAVEAWAEELKAAVPQQAPPAPEPAAPPAATLPPEAQRVMQQVQDAAASAPAAEQGLTAMLGRLRDPTIPYPQLLQEMRAMGFQPPP